MNNPFGLAYYDRQSGQRHTERVFAAGFLHWSYNSRLGRALTQWVLAQPAVSRCCGWMARRAWSKRLIEPFARRMHVDISDVSRFTRPFLCFNDFFVREYVGPMESTAVGPSVCISPSDGKVLILRDLKPQQTVRVKRSCFNLQQLLGNERLGDQFAGGSAVIVRLGLSDYHHFHFPVTGTPGPARVIPGKLYAGGPYGLRKPTPFYVENHRMVTLIDSDLYGTVAQVEIGAFTVGSIRQQFTPGEQVHRGQKKGHFELGGSTVVLVFAAATIEFDTDLSRNSQQEIETRVRLGESIGRASAACPSVTLDLQRVVS
jgi:phosphatidylserine decarboxylase